MTIGIGPGPVLSELKDLRFTLGRAIGDVDEPFEYASHLRLQKPPEQFGEQHERDYQRGIPPIHEVCEDWALW